MWAEKCQPRCFGMGCLAIPLRKQRVDFFSELFKFRFHRFHPMKLNIYKQSTRTYGIYIYDRSLEFPFHHCWHPSWNIYFVEDWWSGEISNDFNHIVLWQFDIPAFTIVHGRCSKKKPWTAKHTHGLKDIPKGSLFSSTGSRIHKPFLIALEILLMEEVLHHLGCIKPFE